MLFGGLAIVCITIRNLMVKIAIKQNLRFGSNYHVYPSVTDSRGRKNVRQGLILFSGY